MNQLRGRSRHALVGWLFLVPLLLCFGLFSWYPIVKGVTMSFQHTNLVDTPTWVGWGNYRSVLKDRLLTKAVGNTAYFVALTFLVGFPVPIILAVLVNELRRARTTFSVLVYLPTVIPPVVSILLWRYLYDPNPTGWLNALLARFGASPVAWLQQKSTVMPALVAEVTWATAGVATIIYLAALRGVPLELYDAADVDGAGFWQKLRVVTLPQIYPVMALNVLFQLVGTVQVFNEPYLFTGGGPRNSTLTVMLLIYRYGFLNEGNLGKAAALSLLVTAVLASITLVWAAGNRLRRRS